MNIQFSSLPKPLQKALLRTELLLGEKMLEYYYQLYDPETGGFYYSISSRDSAGPTPFAEGTSFVLYNLTQGGMKIPDWYKEKVLAWVLPHQDPDDGYFYETLWGKNTKGARKDRDFNYSINIIKYFCDAKPLYPLPIDRLKAAPQSSTVPEWLRGEKEIIAFMDSLDWSTKSIWHTGQKLASASNLIRAAGLYETVHTYVKAKQNPETGLWGEGLSWMNTNGAMKLSGFFRAPEHPYPHVEKMIDSVLQIYSGLEEPTEATYLWNPFVALGYAIESYGDGADALRPLLYEKGAEIVNRAVDCALLLRRPDGGYSSSITGATPTQQNYVFGLGLPNESDLDGTVIAGQRLREAIYEAFGLVCPDDYFADQNDAFWERLKNKPPVVKTLPYLKTERD